MRVRRNVCRWLAQEGLLRCAVLSVQSIRISHYVSLSLLLLIHTGAVAADGVWKKNGIWKMGAIVLGVVMLMAVGFRGSTPPVLNEQLVLTETPILGISRELMPSFHDVLANSPGMANYLYNNQIQIESKVSDGTIYTRQHPGALAESGFAQVLDITMPKFDDRFANGISAYWTFQIRLARVNSGSKWNSYAKGLPTGVQTIYRKSPTNWSGQRVTGWSSTKSFQVIVY